jgi:hypothetical protein
MFGITHRENHRQPRPAKIQSSTLLEDGPCYGGMSHAPLLGDRPGALALGEALASDTAPDAASDEPRAASPQACGASPVAPQHLADIGVVGPSAFSAMARLNGPRAPLRRR